MTETSNGAARKRDKPWIIRTYAGHSTAAEFERALSQKSRQGPDRPVGRFRPADPDRLRRRPPLAAGEVGKVGVSICHLGDMRALFEQIPLAAMNTSMTINATAAWLLALYIAVADEQGASRKDLTGTTQNNIIKEYLSRGTYVFPPGPSMRLTKDVILFTTKEMPKWNPMNVCSYHLQEAGATPVQELAYALATAIAVLDAVKASGNVDEAQFGDVVGRISFFVNAGLRFITELCKMRAFAELWDEITAERYGITDAKQRLFRYGVQVNSLGLTEQQPENNVYRILIEMLAVTLSRKARARAVQLPAWNEALGLPRPWDQQWSLRMQQILAYETDLLEYGDIFAGSTEIENKVAALKREARQELDAILAMGGAVAAVENSYMKSQLVESECPPRRGDRARRADRGRRQPLCRDRTVAARGGRRRDPDGAAGSRNRADRKARGMARGARRQSGGSGPRRTAPRRQGRGAMSCRHRSPARRRASPPANGARCCAKALASIARRRACPRGAQRLPRDRRPARRGRPRHEEARSPAKILVGKPGLDGHSNGAEQIAVRARDAGMDVVYDGIRLTPAEIVDAARAKRRARRRTVDPVGLAHAARAKTW